MYNDALNHLKTDLLSARAEDMARLSVLFDQRLAQALQAVRPNEYVDDCLFQITEALEALHARPLDHLKLRAYLLGAIEALRDELHLCDIDTNVRQTAVGF